MTVILDAGALIAAERGDREVLAVLKREKMVGRVPRSHGGVIGQIWRRGDGRQASLARLLRGVEIHGLDDKLGRRAGVVLGQAGLADVVDAAVVLLCADGDEILTSDVSDLRPLAEAAELLVDLIAV